MRSIGSLTKFATLLPSKFLSLIKPLAFRLMSRNMTHFYSNFVRRGDLVFDVGANEGVHTSCFLQLGASVVCVEPDPAPFNQLRRTFDSNSSVRLVSDAISDAQGPIDFYVCDDYSAVSTTSASWKEGRFSSQTWRKTSVHSTTLDAMIDKFGLPHFCKIDVEGGEKKVLLGLSHTIPYISFEFTKEFITDARFCTNHLSKLGYSSFNVSLYNNFRLQYDTWIEPELLLEKLNSISDPLLCGDILARID
ncbi:FkbM family methyltransferase [Candidatus Micrarchaeota archaeon]|nr:FkbM family methyltransferase [Candidatus Micrarchaeota archaeon]